MTRTTMLATGFLCAFGPLMGQSDQGSSVEMREEPKAAATTMAPPPSGQDYLKATDASQVEGAIEDYLNRNGLKALKVVGNAGAVHFVQVGFLGPNGEPNLIYRITAFPPIENGGQVRLQLIGLMLETNVKAPNPNDSLNSALAEANKVGACSWFVEGGNVRCRSLIGIPGTYAVPTQVILDKLALVTNQWLKYSPQILAAAK